MKTPQMTPEKLDQLYSDTQACAQIIGLSYIAGHEPGLTRIKHGKGFSYKGDSLAQIDAELKERITSLAIPPAWQKVWICPSNSGHILATGEDERGRKQYIYHPKWRTMRDLMKFYRMIIFGGTLPTIRKWITAHLEADELSFEQVAATMLWILDNTYIRIGNDIYYQQNDSVGLTTLTNKNTIVNGSLVTLGFKGKSGKDHNITFENAQIAKIVKACQETKGERLFQYINTAGKLSTVSADDLNALLREITGEHVSAKDFRTWGGTLMAFHYLLEHEDDDKKPEKIVVEAVDAAASILGNTRSVAKASYIHPHLLNVYATQDFMKYYREAHAQRKPNGLDKQEGDLLFFLELLLEHKFTSLKNA